MNKQLKCYTGRYIRFVSAYNGKAIFEVNFSRTTRKATQEYLRIEMELARSDLGCIVRAMKQFADKEREAVGEMPL